MTFLAESSFNKCCRYTSFSESESVEQLYTDTRNCSQKEHQFRRFPSKRGTSSFALLSEVVEDDSTEVGAEGESFVLISTEESNMALFRETN